jgi:hypothetical protein
MKIFAAASGRWTDGHGEVRVCCMVPAKSDNPLYIVLQVWSSHRQNKFETVSKIIVLRKWHLFASGQWSSIGQWGILSLNNGALRDVQEQWSLPPICAGNLTNHCSDIVF